MIPILTKIIHITKTNSMSDKYTAHQIIITVAYKVNSKSLY